MSRSGSQGRRYGPFVQVIEPGRHRYHTTLGVLRLVLAALCAFMLAFGGYAARELWSTRDPLFQYLFGTFFAFIGLACGVLGLVMLCFASRLDITRDGLALSRRWFFRWRTRAWSFEALQGVVVTGMPTFHVGGSTPLYGVALVLEGGSPQKLGASLDTRGSAEALAKAITESVRAMVEEPHRPG